MSSNSKSRISKGKNKCDEATTMNAFRRGQEPSGKSGIDNEIVQFTNLRSKPHVHLTRVAPGCQSKLPVSTFKMLAGRECNYSGRGRFSLADNCHVLSRYLPVNGPWKVVKNRTRAYISQFSADGSLFVAGFQGNHIRVYNVEKGWKIQKDIIARSLRWTITDASLSPDQRFLVYGSLCSFVHMVDVGSATVESHANVTEVHEGFDLSIGVENEEFGIFSVKFSTDGKELVAGTNDLSIYVFDLEACKTSLRIPAHRGDVNSVCFADETGHLIYSGSDDSLCKVWDRRCLKSTGQAAGHLMGHLEGITFIDSRRDGRYFISNGKDQTIKLWDIRKMTSTAKYVSHVEPEWDYRWMDYPTRMKNKRHSYDLSLATYTGHEVLYTLIRCYFSPEFSTGQRYIYTGSSDNSVYIYDLLSGDQLGKLVHHSAPVRDCSWHPTYPMLVSSSWDGTIARWEFPGDGTPQRLVQGEEGFHFEIS